MLAWSATAEAQGPRMRFGTPAPTTTPYGYGVSPAPTAAPPYLGAPAPAYPSATPGAAVPWDPYADPFSQPSVAAPSFGDPYGGYPDPYYGNQVTGPGYGDQLWSETKRLLDELGFQYTWLNGNGPDEFETNVFDTWATFAIPFVQSIEQPTLITPGFAFNFWEGPTPAPDLPPRVYDAYLGAAWKPEFSPTLAADVFFRIGVYSDFEFVNDKSVRIQGGGVGLYRIGPKLQIAVGAWYIDRYRVKLLPAGGLIWTPGPNTRFEIVVPNPKLAWRLPAIRNTDVWAYVAGEYGGGSWTVARTIGTDAVQDGVDYSDLRFIVGIEGKSMRGLTSFLEVGYVFERSIFFLSKTPTYLPNTTVMLRAGFTY